MRPELEDYVRSLGLDAYVVGGAVRDELLGLSSKDADFLVPGVDTDGLKRALEPHGRVEELVVAGRLVGVRLHPRDSRVHALAPAGIEFAPPRATRSAAAPYFCCTISLTLADSFIAFLQKEGEGSLAADDALRLDGLVAGTAFRV